MLRWNSQFHPTPNISDPFPPPLSKAQLSFLSPLDRSLARSPGGSLLVQKGKKLKSPS